MTDPTAWLSDVTPTLTYGVAVVVLSFFVVLWLVARIGRVPPMLKTVVVDRSWFKTPLDRVDEAARAGRIEPAIREVQGLVEGELNSRYHLSASRPILSRIGRGTLPPGAADLLRAVRRLDSARQEARRAEGAELPEFVRKWLGPRWARRARENFEGSLVEIERLLPSTEANRERP